MQIGIGLPATIPGVAGADFLDWARRADDGPFSSLGIIDRLVYGNFEPMIALAAAAGATRAYYAFDPALAEMSVAGVLATSDAITEAIRSYGDAGVDEINLWPTIADLDQLTRLERAVA